MTPALLPRRRTIGENPPPPGCLRLGERYLAAPDETGTERARRLYARYSRETDALFYLIVAQTCAYLALGQRHAEQKYVTFSEADEVSVSGMRRQFKRGLGLAGVVERGWVDRRVFDVAERTGYALRYAYAILEEQSKTKVDALLKKKNPWSLATSTAAAAAPRWAKFMRRG